MEDKQTKPASPAKKKSGSSKYAWRRLGAVFTILFLIWWFNNYTLKTTKVELRSKKVKEPIRLAVLSDQHATKLGISNKRIEKRIKDADPDIVMILGDMYTSGSDADIRQIPVDLAADIVSDGYPVYFVSGEHDTERSYISDLRKAGVHVMNYESETLTVKGSKIAIYGIDNVYYSPTFDLSKEYTLDEKCFNILMAHIPNYEKFEDFGADLTLCADTHGCMVQLPFGLGPAFYSDAGTWFPHFTDKELEVYDKGMFSYNGGKMFITSGIGVSPFPIRFNNRPEIAVIDIIPE